jgi:hypothetical protein
MACSFEFFNASESLIPVDSSCILPASETKDGESFDCSDFNHVVITVISVGFVTVDDAAVVKAKISHSKDEPDWETADADNRWTTAALVDQSNSAESLTGDTGVVLDKDSETIQNYRVNTNAQNRINASISSFAGTTTTKTVSVLISGYTND